MRPLALLLLVALVAPAAAAQGDEAPWPDGATNPYGRSPIRVHVDPGPRDVRTDALLEEVRRAFAWWDAGGNGALAWEADFAHVATPEEADLLVFLTSQTQACGSGRAAGCGMPPHNGSKGLVVVKTAREAGPRYTPSEVQLVARHEIGHALGLAHARDPTDIMYPRLHLGPGAAPSDGGILLLQSLGPMVFGLAVLGVALRGRRRQPVAAPLDAVPCRNGPYHDFDADGSGRRACTLCGYRPGP